MNFDVNPVGLRFQLFGTSHLVALAIIAGLAVALMSLRSVLGERARRAIRYGMAFIMVGAKLSDYAWRWTHQPFDPREDLPLHLCTLMTFVSAALLVSRSQRLYELVYFLGLGGSTQALVTPEIGAMGFPHLYFYVSFISHGGIVITALYMTVVEGFRPSWRAVWRVAACMFVYMLVVMGINSRLGSNYLWVSRKPDFPSLIDMLGPWPWYVLSLVAVGVVTMTLLYLPFAVLDLRRSRREGVVAG